MYPASAAFKTALSRDHVVVSKAEVWNQNQKLIDLPISSGSVSADASSTVRRTCNVTLFQQREANNLVPNTGFDYLTPYGNELRLFRGIKFADGTVEYVPLGVFEIIDVSISDTNDGIEIDITGLDRSVIISRNKLIDAYTLTTGTLESSITNLLQNRYADVQTNFPTTNISVEQVVIGTDNARDAWKSAVELCSLVGYDLYFDVFGVAIMRQFPSIDGAVVVATYIEGEGTTITSLDRSISSRETYNGIIYTAQGSRFSPIQVQVWDEDTTSPTYRYGVFGSSPKFIDSQLVSTETDAIKAATSLLNRYIGAQETINWESMVDPTLEPNDVVYIKTVGSKVDRLVIIDSIEIPLGADETMSANARVVRIVGENEIVGVGNE